MANILLGNFVWEGLHTELPTALEGAMDGHIFKALDTGESYIRRYGAWVLINLGLSQIAATKSGSVQTNANGLAHITFTTDLINSEYTVALSVELVAGRPAAANFSNLTVSGFDIMTMNSRNAHPEPNRTVSWLATRNYNP